MAYLDWEGAAASPFSTQGPHHLCRLPDCARDISPVSDPLYPAAGKRALGTVSHAYITAIGSYLGQRRYPDAITLTLSVTPWLVLGAAGSFLAAAAERK